LKLGLIVTGDGWTALHFAAYCNNFEIGKLLVEAENSLLTATDEWGKKSALHYASEDSNLEFVEYLVGKGMDPLEKDDFGQISLHYAAEGGKEENVEYLLQLNPEIIDCKDKRGRTALHLAAKKGETKVVQCFIESGADLEIRDTYGRTALHFHEDSVGHLECAKLLVAAKPSLLEAKTNRDESVLHFASQFSDLDVVKYFVEKGVNPKDRDKKGRNALHWAAKWGKVENAKYLLEISRDLINEVDNEGNCALHIAAGRGRLEMVKFLCNEFGSRLISLKNKANKTPIDVKPYIISCYKKECDKCSEFMRNFQEAHPN